MSQNVRERFQQNLYDCMEIGGAHFEHLMGRKLYKSFYTYY